MKVKLFKALLVVPVTSLILVMFLFLGRVKTYRVIDYWTRKPLKDV